MVTFGFPFQKSLKGVIGVGATPFLGLLHFSLDTHLNILSVKQGCFKYHF